MKLYDRLFPPQAITLENGHSVLRPRSRMPLIIAVLAVMTWIAVYMTGFRFSVILRRGGQFFVILKAMFPPDWSYLPQVWTPLMDTVKMSLAGSFIGGALAMPAAILASQNITRNKVVVSIMRVILGLMRTFPTLIVALVATYIFGLGTVAGTVAIGVFSFSYIGKIVYELIETADMGAFEALEAVGSTRLRAFIGAIAPQIIPLYLSNCLYNFEGNVRYAAILGYVGAGGLGLILNEKIGWREYDRVGTILVSLFVTVFIIETVSRYLRERLVRGIA